MENVGSNVSSTKSTYSWLFADERGKLYLNYVDFATGELAVKTFNNEVGEWQPLGNNVSNLYLSTGTVVNTNSGYSSSHNSWMSFDANGNPYVVYSEFSSNGVPYVKKFNGTASKY